MEGWGWLGVEGAGRLRLLVFFFRAVINVCSNSILTSSPGEALSTVIRASRDPKGEQ